MTPYCILSVKLLYIENSPVVSTVDGNIAVIMINTYSTMLKCLLSRSSNVCMTEISQLILQCGVNNFPVHILGLARSFPFRTSRRRQLTTRPAPSTRPIRPRTQSQGWWRISPTSPGWQPSRWTSCSPWAYRRPGGLARPTGIELPGWRKAVWHLVAVCSHQY